MCQFHIFYILNQESHQLPVWVQKILRSGLIFQGKLTGAASSMPWSPPRPRPRPFHGLPLIFLFLLSIPRPLPGPLPRPLPLSPTKREFENQTHVKHSYQADLNDHMKSVWISKAFIHGCCFIPRMFPRFICSLAWRPLPWFWETESFDCG